MSEYFRVLKRMEQGGAPREARPLALATAAPVAAPTEGAAPQRAAVSAPAPSSPGANAFAALFDSLRALDLGGMPRVVFAAASPSACTSDVVEGLAAHASQLGLQVLVADLVQGAGGPLLRARHGGDGLADGDGEIALDLRGRSRMRTVSDWLQRAAPEADLVLIEAPPLSQSIDAPLLACACDGLVIVAHTEITTRQAMRTAAERSRSVGCRGLGVVMHGTRDHMPAWLRHLPLLPQALEEHSA